MDFARQVSGARGVLSWSRKDLSDVSGVSQRAIEEIEKGNSDVRESTRQAITQAFASHEIDFTRYGIEERKDRIVFLYDFLDVLADAEKVLKADDEILLHCAAESKNTPEVTAKFAQLCVNRIRLRFTICEGDRVMTTDSSNYRWIDRDYFANSEVSLIYANRYARHIVENGRDTFVIIRNNGIADVERRHFEFFWKIGKYAEK